jgi:septum site-determining protein MinC
MNSTVYTAGTSQTKTFELKGEMSMLSVLRLLDSETEHIARELDDKVKQAPDFFRNMPVIIDLQVLSERNELPVFPVLITILRNYGLVPVGVRNGSTMQNNAARQAGMALLPEHHAAPQVPLNTDVKGDQLLPTEATPRVVEPPYEQPRKSRMVLRPVRSGQQIYVPEGDLIVVAPVGAGSELLVDGCIHVYGPLRGRALAGVNGDETARIFCQRLEAELVAIAGHYQINEDMAPEWKKKSVQVWLENERLMISTL